jgi:hypothetical protein
MNNVMTEQNRIEKTENVTREKWLSYCCKAQGVTFFHTPMWAELFTHHNPGRFRIAAKELEFSDGTKIMLPLVKKRYLLGLKTVVNSMPSSTFGGFLSSETLSERNEHAAMAYLNRYQDLIFRENPYAPVRFAFPGGSGCNDPTLTIDLHKGYHAVWRRATAGHRNAVRNAVKSGVEVVEASGISDWMVYSSIYTSSIERWKRRNVYNGVFYDTRFFLLVATLKAPLRKLWLARIKGETIAGILCFYWGNHVVVWHGSGLSDFFSLHPNNLLYDRAIEHAVTAGFRWFDTNPSGNLKGVYKFKQYLGAEPKQSRVLVKYSPSFRFLQKIKIGFRGDRK